MGGNSVWRVNAQLTVSVPLDWSGVTTVRQEERKPNGGWSNRLIRRWVNHIHPDFRKAIEEHFFQPVVYGATDFMSVRYRKKLERRS